LDDVGLTHKQVGRASIT